MSDNNELFRTFLGIDLPENIKSLITNLYPEKKDKIIRLVPGKNLHITIKFLGDITEKKLIEVKQTLSNLKLDLNIKLSLNSHGVFPIKGYPKILWLSFEDKKRDISEIVFPLIEKSFDRINFPKEKRKFTPHATIGRIKIKNNSDMNKYKKIIKPFEIEFNKIKRKEFKINKLTLFKSQLTPEGAVYSKIGEY